jgi:polyhydroxyalkanoate synthesis repressor PhaR
MRRLADAACYLAVMPRVIKRYANRKLYDAQASRYVSLDDLLALIRSGENISVVDAGTGEDLTSVTLAQVILERERGRGAGGLPSGFLHQVIRHGETWGEFVTSSMRASLEGMLTTQRQADSFFRDWAARAGFMPSGPPGSPAAEGAEPPPEPVEPVPAPEPEAPAADGESEDLRRQLAALEARLRALEGERDA